MQTCFPVGGVHNRIDMDALPPERVNAMLREYHTLVQRGLLSVEELQTTWGPTGQIYDTIRFTVTSRGYLALRLKAVVR